MRKVFSFLKWTVFSIAVLISVLFISLMWSIKEGDGGNAANTKSGSSNQKNRVTAGVACQTAIKQNLNNPSSAEIVDRLNWPATLDDGVWTVHATYRATNGFGAVITDQATCKARDGSFSALLIR